LSLPGVGGAAVIHQVEIREQLPPSLKSLAVACPGPEEQDLIETKNKNKKNKEEKKKNKIRKVGKK
jgi:hypothetical protein